jgi:hypothetical protein
MKNPQTRVVPLHAPEEFKRAIPRTVVHKDEFIRHAPFFQGGDEVLSCANGTFFLVVKRNRQGEVDGGRALHGRRGLSEFSPAGHGFHEGLPYLARSSKNALF